MVQDVKLFGMVLLTCMNAHHAKKHFVKNVKQMKDIANVRTKNETFGEDEIET